MSTNSINGVKASGTNKDVKQTRPAQIKVKPGENLSVIAKKFGMNVKEFMKWTGLKKTSINAGQTINLPTSKVPEGKGILALAKKYNMTLEEFGKLNNLPKPYNTYKANKDEIFYVKNNSKSSSRTSGTTTPKTSSNTTPKPAPKPKEAPKVETNPALVNKQKWDSSFTPAELADKIYEGSKKWAAVGKPDFDALINEINPKNVEAVLKAYTEKESLVDTLISEVGSDKADRENAVMKVFNALAKAKGVSEETKEAFKNELHEQLYKFWGFAKSTELDKTINSILDGKSAAKAPKAPAPPAQNSGEAAALTTVRDANGNRYTKGQLQKGAIASAKRDKGFSKVKKPFIQRPLPNTDANGKIEASAEIKFPTNSNGPMKGKVVFVNPGHGGYRFDNGYFDSGTVLSVKNAEGDHMPIEEWRVAQSYAQELTQKLQEKGATVVIVTGCIGDKKTGKGGMSEDKYLQKMLQGQKGPKEVRELMKNTSKSNMAFISLHVESTSVPSSQKLCTVRSNDAGDKALAKKVEDNIAKNIPILTPKQESNKYYIHRAMGTEIPAVLIEIGNIQNESITNSLLSSNDRGKYTAALANALQETLVK